MATTAPVKTTLYGKEGDAQYPLLPSTTAEQVSINDADGSASTVDAEIISLRSKVAELLNSGICFKGSLTSTSGLPTVSYKAGWQYIVQEAGTYAGQTCEVGDFLVCIKDYASGSASDSDWTVLQANITGAVTGPASSVANRVAVFDGTTGKLIKDSGKTLGTSVPEDAKFTDTTYSPATANADGLMTAAHYKKLEAITAGADVTNATTVAAAGAFMKASDTADSIKDGTANVMMTAEERTKLTNVEAGAQPNQNAISKVTVGSSTITASSTTDTLTLAAGSGITLTADTSAKKVTIAETYVDSCVVTSLDKVPTNLRNGGLIILRS